MIKKDQVCNSGITEYFLRHYPDFKPEPCPQDQIELCRKFINECMIQVNSDKKALSSYHLKHSVERFYNKYISNGAFIMAAIQEGIEQYRNGLGPNTVVYLDYKTRSIKEKCNGGFIK